MPVNVDAQVSKKTRDFSRDTSKMVSDRKWVDETVGAENEIIGRVDRGGNKIG